MVDRRLPGELHEEIVVRLSQQRRASRSRFETVPLANRARHALGGLPIDPGARVGEWRHREPRSPRLHVRDREVVKAAAHDRAADAHAVLQIGKRGNGRAGGVASDEAPRGEGAEHGAAYVVRARSRDRVHQSSGESSLPHVERSDEDSNLLDRLERECPGARSRTWRDPGSEDVALRPSIDLNGVEPVVLAAHREQRGAARLRREREQADEVAVEQGKASRETTSDAVRRPARSGVAKWRRAYDDRVEPPCRLRTHDDRAGDAISDMELESLDRRRLVTERACRELVRTARRQVLEVESAVGLRDGAPSRSRADVPQLHDGVRHGGTIRAPAHPSHHRGAAEPLRLGARRRERRQRERDRERDDRDR